MPYGGEGCDLTFPAAADLSSYQYHIIAIDANGRATVAIDPQALTIIGILQNKPAAADAAARVRVHGISKLVFGAAVNEGVEVTSNPEGYGTAAATTKDFVVGKVLHAPGGSGDVQDVLVTQYRYHS